MQLKRYLSESYLFQVTKPALAILFIISFSFCANAQILRDSSQTRKVNKCVSYIYNFQFNDAENLCNQLEAAFPKSPAIPLIRGMIIYWKNFPLLPSSRERTSYEKELQRSIAMSEKKKPYGDETEYLLADMCARGLLLLFYSDNDMSGEVIPLATSTWKYLKESFNYTKVCPDFYFFTGLYHYYREKYPEIHPIYKPLAALFPPGDADTGLKELQKALKESIVLNAEAGGFLSWIYSGYEFDYKSSEVYSRLLVEKYPDNPYFQANNIKYLLLQKKFDEAEILLSSMEERTKNSYFKAQALVFRAILQEKKYDNKKAAADIYKEALASLNKFGDFGNEYSAYACFGLSRVAEPGKSGDIRKKYRKEAVRQAEFSHMTFDD